MISQKTISEILATARIEEVIGDFVYMKRKGGNFSGLCPFHDEKTPSFLVSPSKEIYKCFGCGKSGNVVRFLMEHEKYTYPESLKFLAKKYHITIEEEELSEEDRSEQDEVSSIYIVLSYAQKFFHSYLLESEEGKSIGIPYFKSRGFDEEIILKFQLGLSPSGVDTFTSSALKAGYKEEFLIASGLSIRTYDDKLIDRFRERVMFPITSITGRTLGFGGRTLRKDPKEAKYINSPETKVYSKGNILFGLDQAKNQIRKSDNCYLVEGYTDALSLFKAGIENVVASLGTSLTENHLKLVKRYTNNLTFVFDGDAAGIKASLRAFDIALKQELNVKAVMLPEGQDPDTFAQNNSNISVQQFLSENAQDFILFKTNLIYKKGDIDPIEKIELVKNILHSISQIPNPINRSVYIKTLSKDFEMDEEILYSELNKMVFSGIKQSSIPQKTEFQEKVSSRKVISDEDKKRIQDEQEKEIMKLLIIYGNTPYSDETTISDVIIPVIQDAEWNNHFLMGMFNYYLEFLSKNQTGPEVQDFLVHPNLEFQNLAIEFSIQPYFISENWKNQPGQRPEPANAFKKEVDSAIFHYRLRKLQELERQSMKDLRKPGITVEDSENLQKIKKLINEDINTLSKEFSLVIY